MRIVECLDELGALRCLVLEINLFDLIDSCKEFVKK